MSKQGLILEIMNWTISKMKKIKNVIGLIKDELDKKSI